MDCSAALPTRLVSGRVLRLGVREVWCRAMTKERVDFSNGKSDTVTITVDRATADVFVRAPLGEREDFHAAEDRVVRAFAEALKRG